MTGCKDSSEAVDHYRKAKSKMKDGGFTLKKWKINSSEVAKEKAYTPDNEMQVKDVSVSSEVSYAKETLGLDILGKVGKESDNSVCATKRGILRPRLNVLLLMRRT